MAGILDVVGKLTGLTRPTGESRVAIDVRRSEQLSRALAGTVDSRLLLQGTLSVATLPALLASRGFQATPLADRQGVEYRLELSAEPLVAQTVTVRADRSIEIRTTARRSEPLPDWEQGQAPQWGVPDTRTYEYTDTQSFDPDGTSTGVSTAHQELMNLARAYQQVSRGDDVIGPSRTTPAAQPQPTPVPDVSPAGFLLPGKGGVRLRASADPSGPLAEVKVGRYVVDYEVGAPGPRFVKVFDGLNYATVTVRPGVAERWELDTGVWIETDGQGLTVSQGGEAPQRVTFDATVEQAQRQTTERLAELRRRLAALYPGAVFDGNLEMLILDTTCRIAQGAHVVGPARLLNGSSIGSGATVERSTLAQAHVGEESRVVNCALESSTAAAHCDLEDSQVMSGRLGHWTHMRGTKALNVISLDGTGPEHRPFVQRPLLVTVRVPPTASAADSLYARPRTESELGLTRLSLAEAGRLFPNAVPNPAIVGGFRVETFTTSLPLLGDSVTTYISKPVARDGVPVQLDDGRYLYFRVLRSTRLSDSPDVPLDPARVNLGPEGILAPPGDGDQLMAPPNRPGAAPLPYRQLFYDDGFPVVVADGRVVWLPA